MILTRRGKHRLLILLAGVVLVAMAFAGFLGLRGVHRARLAAEARAVGLEAYDAGDYEAAIESLRYPHSRNPQDLDVVLALAHSRARVAETNNRHLAQAVSLFTEALRIEPENREALAGLLPLYRQLDYRTELNDVADRLLRVDPANIEALSMKARTAYLNGDLDEVLALAERLASMEPQELQWRALYLTALRAQGEDDEAVLAACHDWIAAHEQDGRFKLLAAQLLAEFGRANDARDTLLEATKLGTDSPAVFRAMLGMLDALGLEAEVTALLEDARARFPGDEWVVESAGRHHWQALRFDEALAELAAIERKGGGPSLRLLAWKAVVHATRGDRERALEIAGRIEGSDDPTPGDRELVRAWAEAVTATSLLAGNDWVAAIDAHRRALALRPDDEVLQYLLARTYQQVGEQDLAIEIFARLAEQEPGWLGAQVARAESLLAVGRAPEAFAILGKMIERRPQMPVGAFLALGRAWLEVDPAGERVRLTDVQTGRRVGLVDLLERLRTRLGWHTETVVMLAEAYLRQDRTAEALELTESAIDDPDAPAGTLLALADLTERWNLGQEQRLVAEARQRGGSPLAVALARASHLARRGRTDEAIAVLDEAIGAAGAGAPAVEGIEWARVKLLLETDAPDASRTVRELLGRSRRPGEAFSLLALESFWRDRELARSVIEHMKEVLGDRFPQVLLAEAQYLQRCEGDDPAAVARAQALVGDVLKASPRSKPALSLMATLQLTGDETRYEDAIRTFRTAVDAYPNELRFYAPLVRLLQQGGDFSSARRHILELSDRSGENTDLRRTVVELLEAQGDFMNAASELDTLVDDTSPAADQLWLVSLLSRDGRRDRAQAILDRLLEAPQAGNEVILAAADFHAAGGHLDEAVALLEGRLDVADESVRARRIGELLLRNGAVDLAERHVRRAIDLDPAAVDAWTALASLRLAQGDLADARRAITRGLEIEPENDALRTMLAVTSVSSDSVEQGQLLAVLEELGRATPAGERLARLLGRLGDPSGEDLAEVRELVREHPGLLPAWRVAIDMHAAAGRWHDALDLARQAVGRLPAHPAPAEMATRLLIRMQRTDEALEMAHLWRGRTLESPLPAETVIAALLVDRRRPVEAVEALAPYADRIWAERERFPDRVEVWLTALLAAGRTTDATRTIERLLTEEDARHEWSTRCVSMASKLDHEPADALLSLIEPRVTGDPADRLRLAIAWNDLAHRTDDATAYDRSAELAESVSSDPSLASVATIVQADNASARGDLARAETLYRSLVTVDSEDVLVLNNLADVLTRQGERCDEAIALAERAGVLANDDPAVVETLASALLCAGRYEEAEGRLQAVLREGRTHVACLVTLARVLHAQGRTPDARGALERARRELAATARPDADLRRRLEETAKLLEEKTTVSMRLTGPLGFVR